MENKSNESQENYMLENERLVTSFQLLDRCREINIFSSVFVVAFGLIGNFFAIFMFTQKRFRVNSHNVYLLCLASNDSLFLVIHFFENTVKNYNQHYLATSIQQYSHKNSTNSSESINLFKSFIMLINIADRYQLACQLLTYIRYVLRFVSGYIGK